MSLQEIAKSKGSLCNRTYYKDDQGRLVECLHHDGETHQRVVDENAEDKANFRSHDGTNFRKVASIPVDLMLKWLMEEGVPSYMGAEALDLVINKKLRDPEVKRLLTVPDNYEMKRYE